MKIVARSTLRMLMGVSAVALLIGVAPHAVSALQVTDDNVVQQVQAAKTSADHQALADYFNAKASAATANAAKHESMTGVSQHGSSDVWRQHCGSLVKTFRTQAADYHALAKQQEKLAKV